MLKNLSAKTNQSRANLELTLRYLRDFFEILIQHFCAASDYGMTTGFYQVLFWSNGSCHCQPYQLYHLQCDSLFFLTEEIQPAAIR